MFDKFMVERFSFENDPVKELSVYKDNGRWYARVVLERTIANGTVQRFTLPKVAIPPVCGILSAHTEGEGYFVERCYHKLDLQNDEFVLMEGYDDKFGGPAEFYVQERKYITREKAEEMLSMNGTTYIIVDEEDDDD